MDDKLTILLCEDDENLGMLLREFLMSKGFIMPKKDGFTLAKEIRGVNSEIPIVFLTAKNMKEDVLEGFHLGADDYITKPFSMEELVSRISAILRRVRGKKEKEITMFRIGQFTFDTQKQTLVIGNESKKLTTKVSELRKLLKDDPSIEIINIHGKGYKLIAPTED